MVDAHGDHASVNRSLCLSRGFACCCVARRSCAPHVCNIQSQHPAGERGAAR